YRSDMIRRCGVAIFIAGTSRTSPVSKGVMEEFELARKLGKIIIPLGLTGHAAREIWTTLEPSVESAYGKGVSKELFGRLNDPALDNKTIIDSVFEIIQRAARDAIARVTGEHRLSQSVN
ncbi:MAG TPA: hypothetical protein VFZ26_14525, partial [Gemmatimonadales bacterium]